MEVRCLHQNMDYFYGAFCHCRICRGTLILQHGQLLHSSKHLILYSKKIYMYECIHLEVTSENIKTQTEPKKQKLFSLFSLHTNRCCPSAPGLSWLNSQAPEHGHQR